MGSLNLDYDINNMYQVVADVMTSLWPIIAAGLAVLLATFVLSGIVTAFRKFIDERR